MFAVSENESLPIMLVTMAAGTQYGIREVAESLDAETTKRQRDRTNWEWRDGGSI